MFYFQGGSLKSIIQADGSLPEVSIRTIGVHICQGLYYLHQQDIIFCDLNPEKVREELHCMNECWIYSIDRFRWFECV